MVTAGDYPELEDMFNQVNSTAQTHPEMEFDWTTSAEQQAFAGILGERGAAEGQTLQNNTATSDGDGNSLRIVSPPRTPPPLSLVISGRDDAVSVRVGGCPLTEGGTNNGKHPC